MADANAMMAAYRQQEQPYNAMLDAARAQPQPQTWGDLAASFGRHLAGLPGQMVESAWNGLTAPRDAYQGRIPANEMLTRAMDTAGLATLGGYMSPKPANALGSAGGGKGITAYHGSPHDFDKFDMSRIGTGEGAQAYGHGLYFAEAEAVAKDYRNKLGKHDFTVGGQPFDEKNPVHFASQALEHYGDRDKAIAALSPRKSMWSDRMMDDPLSAQARQLLESGADVPAYSVVPTGRMYEVRINAEPEQFLDWDKPLSQQSETIQKALEGLPQSEMVSRGPNGEWVNTPILERDGETFFAALAEALGKSSNDSVAASNALRDAGIVGVRYLDGNSRTAGEGSRNYAVFDDKIVEILRKYGLLGMIGGGAAVAGSDQGQAAP